MLVALSMLIRSSRTARGYRVAALAVGLVAGCSRNHPDETESWVGVQPGFIEFYDRPIDIQAPETARAGDTVTIMVTTYGDGQCIKFHDTDVAVSGNAVEIVPLDYFEERAGNWCPDILVSIKHQVRVALIEPGATKVLVKGRRWPGNETISGGREIVTR